MRQNPLFWLDELNLREKHRQKIEVSSGGMFGNARFNIALREGSTLQFATRVELPQNFDGLDVIRVLISPAALEFFPEPIECEPELIVRLDHAQAALDVLLRGMLHDVERTMLVVTEGVDQDALPRPLLGTSPLEAGGEVDSDGYAPLKNVNLTNVSPL